MKPDSNLIFPVPGIDSVTYIKAVVKNPNIIAGDFSYFAGKDFESHVTHLYEWNNDKLIIGKFCQIGAGVEFIMNGANHQMNCLTTYPFYIFKSWNQSVPDKSLMPLKGDTVIENDVWIGQNVTILPGVHIGNGAIIGANSTVASDVDAYTVVAGNPARFVHKRFDNELISLLLNYKWWDKSIEEINSLIICSAWDDHVIMEVIAKEFLEETV